jgi:hypothetical protein
LTAEHAAIVERMRYRIAHGWPRKPIAVIIEEGEA